jgi:aspartate/methionine/tyrosine aminotransferase
MKMVESIARINWTCIPHFIQKAATKIFLDPSVSGGKEELLAEYKRRRDLTMDGLESAEISCVKPKGSIYAFPRISEAVRDSFELADTLLMKYGVGVVPGGYFGDRGLYNVRICFTAPPTTDVLLEGMQRFADGTRQLTLPSQAVKPA